MCAVWSQYPGFRVLCPTRWTVRAESMKSILDSWVALQQVWDESLDGHALNLAVGDMVKRLVRFLKDSMDTTYKISNLL